MKLQSKMLKSVYKGIVKPIAVTLLKVALRCLDKQRWVPVFFLLLTRVNTNDMMLLQVLHNVRVKTGRRVILVTAWPFWPRTTQKDPCYRQFLRELTPTLQYIWIPVWLHKFIKRCVPLIFRVLQIQDVLLRPMGLNSTFRYTDVSTLLQTDVLNEGGKIVLQIPSSYDKRCQAKLRELGIGADDWFVCVHARDNGWIKDQRPYDLNIASDYPLERDEYRNVDIETYYPAIDYIKSKGGVVIRMGDASMNFPNQTDRFINYPFTKHKDFLMDLYLVANCRFVLGCDSGFSSNFPVAFGKPLLVTNVASTIITARWPYVNTRFLLKPVIDKKTGRIVSLKERSHPRLSDIHNALTFEEMGYQWLPNTSQDILDATVEMLDAIEEEAFETPLTIDQSYFNECRQQSLEVLWCSSEQTGDENWSKVLHSQSRISSTFSRRHYRTELEAEKVG